MGNQSNNAPSPSYEGGTPLIVIGRLTGSGGRRIGRKVAERLGVRYFDKELLKECAETYHYPAGIFEEADEKRPPLLRSFLHARFGVGDPYAGSPMNREEIYRAQAQVIRSLAQEQPGVFVGRTADYIMRDHPSLVSVFLHAPAEFRARRLMDYGEAKSMEEAHARIRKNDSRRKDYYNYFTCRQWGQAANYHLSIDSSLMSEDEVADMIVKYARAAVGSPHHAPIDEETV